MPAQAPTESRNPTECTSSGEGEQPHGGRRASGGPGDHRHRHHRHRPEDRRFPAGEQTEEEQDGRGRGEAAADGQPAEERRDEGEDEGQVLAGDDEQVREAGAAEVVDDFGRLTPVVPEDEAEEQRAVGGRQGRRAATEGAPNPVGQTTRRITGLPATDAVDGQARGDVAGGEACARPGWDGFDLSGDGDALACQAVGEAPGGCPVGPALDSLVTDADLDACLGTDRCRIAHEGDDAFEGAVTRRMEPGPRARGQRAREQRHADDEEERPSAHDSDDNCSSSQRKRRGPGAPRSRGGAERQEDSAEVGHTRTSDFRLPSFAGPMPVTERRSSTVRKRPCRVR